MNFVLFDLDNTVVDAAHLKPLRDQRRWAEVYQQIATIAVFAGIRDLWRRLQADGVHLGIVTHSPRSYATRVLAHVGLAADVLVAYHDLHGRRKPSPYGYELGCAGRMSRCGLAVGDERHDLVAVEAFGSVGVFAGWSRAPQFTKDDCKRGGWIYVTHPRELIELVENLPKS